MSEQKSLTFNDQRLWTPISGGTYGTESDARLMGAYLNNDVVYSCAELNATQVASTYYHLYQIGGRGTVAKAKSLGKKFKRLNRKQASRIRKQIAEDDEVIELTEHPIIDLLSKTNEDLNGYQIWKATQLSLEIFGRAYWLLEDRNAATGLPSSIRVLKSYHVNPVRDSEGLVVSYSYTNILSPTKKETVNLDLDDVISFRTIAINDLYGGGQSWVSACYDKIELSKKFVDYQQTLLDNKCRPDSLLIPQTEMLDKEAAKALQDNFEQRTRGGNNGRPIVLQEQVKYQPLQYQPTDLAPLQFNQEMVKSICNASGVPFPILMGDATYANSATAVAFWTKSAILPRVVLLEQILNDSLVSLFGDNLYLEFDSPVPADDKFELEQQKVSDAEFGGAISAGAITINEIRERLGFEPIDGGDELPQPAAAFGLPELPTESPATALEAPQSDESAVKGLDVAQLLKINQAVSKGELDRAVAVNVAALALNVDQAEAKRLVTHRAKGCSCGCTSKALPRVGTPGRVAPHKPLVSILRAEFAKQKKHYLAQLRNQKSFNLKADDGLPSEFVPLEDWDEELSKKSKPVIELSMKKTADGRQQVLQRIGASPDVFSVVPAKITEAVDKASLKFAASTNATTAKNLNDALASLRDELKQGLFEGNSVDEMTARVQGVFENADDDRAELIAKSEISRAVHEGQRIAARESKIVSGFRLLVSADACPLCQSYADVEIGLDEKFDKSNDYDDSPVPLHPGCECSLLEVLNLDGGNEEAIDDEG